MKVPLNLWRLFAGVGIVGLVIAGFIHLPTSNSQQVDRAIGQSPGFAIDLPRIPPIVSSDPTSEQADLSTTAGVDIKTRPVRPNSAQSALQEAQVSVSLSQAQLAQARINLSEFQVKHDSAKILSEQGKVSRQQANTAKTAYELAQLQHSSAEIGLKESQAQLIAAKAEVSRLGCKANTTPKM